jgi:hypothetical protein
MASSIEIVGTLKALRGERAKMQGELAKLDKAITVLEGLFGTSTTTSNGNRRRRTLSPDARRRIGKAQKLRWAKVRKERAAKA